MFKQRFRLEAAEQVGSGGADGVVLPNTKLGFFGTTPVAKQTITLTTATATTATNEATINAILTALSNHGLITVTGP